MAKINMNVILGEPGTGKSYDLISKAIELERDLKSVYIFTPTRTSKKRLVSGYFERKRENLVLNNDIIFNLVRDTHVLQENYSQEGNILIDEFSMITTDQFYSLLYRCLIAPQSIINLTVYADEKQLEPIKGMSALMLLIKSNLDKFKGLSKENFWSYIQNNFYDWVEDQELHVPDSWKKAIDKISLTIKHNNHRLKEKNGIVSFNNSFYDDVLQNKTIEEINYSDDILDRVNQQYLIISSTHARGKQVDNILNENIENPESKAPFIRNIDKPEMVFLNPNCKVQYEGFDFIPNIDGKINKEQFNPSWYTTVHYCQGATVNNALFFMGNDDIPNNKKGFYTRNMLYVGLTRARYNNEFFGKKENFLKMMTTYPEDGSNAVSKGLASKALDMTYQMVVDLTPYQGKLSNEEILKLYKENFNKVLKKNGRKIEEVNIMSDFVFEPYDNGVVMKVLDPNYDNKWNEPLKELGYGFQFSAYLRSVKSNAGKIGANAVSKQDKSKGGQASKVKEWLTTLDSKEFQELKNDVVNLPMRKFKNKWKHDRRAVEKNVVIF